MRRYAECGMREHFICARRPCFILASVVRVAERTASTPVAT
jgi:hypothetical protein